MARTRKPRVYQDITGVCRRCGATTRPIPVVPTDQTPVCACGGQLEDRPDWTQPLATPAATIPYPRKLKHDREFVIQAYLLAELRALKWDVHAEIRVPGQRDRFDIVVYNADKVAVRIIEVKPADAAGVTQTAREFVSWHWRDRTKNELDRYRAYGIPVDLVQGMDGAKKYVEWARQRSTPG
jgi:hypothetical protein